MKIIEKIEDGLPVFDALNSEIRIRIIRLLLHENRMNMNEIAAKLDLPKSTLTPHIKKLVSAGIIDFSLNSDTRGTQKICRLAEDKILINIMEDPDSQKVYVTDLDAGQYSSCNVLPTCGLATSDHIIGNGFDDPRFFNLPDRFNASILWFAQGYVEYTIANMLSPNDDPIELQIFLELCSEAPGVLSNYPSDITFYVNGIKLGFWTSPGEFVDRKGRYTPDWWFLNFPQHGIMKVIAINEMGTFLDGLFLSPITIHQLDLKNNSAISLRIAVPEDAKDVGGLTLFGKNFGDYASGIRVRMICDGDKTSNLSGAAFTAASAETSI